MRNPLISTVRMKAPENSGPMISLEGFEIEIESDGTVTVPARHKVTLEAHGFTEAKDEPAVTGKRK